VGMLRRSDAWCAACAGEGESLTEAALLAAGAFGAKMWGSPVGFPHTTFRNIPHLWGENDDADCAARSTFIPGWLKFPKSGIFKCGGNSGESPKRKSTR
jgi:hypothetical protein